MVQGAKGSRAANRAASIYNKDSFVAIESCILLKLILRLKAMWRAIGASIISILNRLCKTAHFVDHVFRNHPFE
jgi:hypothetical protein